MKKLTAGEVTTALYLTSPCGPAELRGHLHGKFGDFDETSLARVLEELVSQGKVVQFTVQGVVMWCLRGQRVG